MRQIVFSCMPILHNGTDTHTTTQKLSKIETLRLARNYILAMSQTLQEGKPMELVRFIKILSRELSQTTANLLNGTLIGPVNSNSFVAFRRYEYPVNHQEGSNNVPYHIEWQDLNGDCTNNNTYNNWYANYKFHGNTRFDRFSDNYATPENCLYDSYSKQLFYTEW